MDKKLVLDKILLIRSFILSEYASTEAWANGGVVSKEAEPAWNAIHDIINRLDTSEPPKQLDHVKMLRALANAYRIEGQTAGNADLKWMALVHSEAHKRAADALERINAEKN